MGQAQDPRSLIANALNLAAKQGTIANKRAQIADQSVELTNLITQVGTKIKEQDLRDEQATNASIKDLAKHAGTDPNQDTYILNQLADTEREYTAKALAASKTAADLGSVGFFDNPLMAVVNAYRSNSYHEDAVAYARVADTAHASAAIVNNSLAQGVESLKAISKTITDATVSDQLKAYAAMAAKTANDEIDKSLATQSEALKLQMQGNKDVMDLVQSYHAMGIQEQHLAIARENLANNIKEQNIRLGLAVRADQRAEHSAALQDQAASLAISREQRADKKFEDEQKKLAEAEANRLALVSDIHTMAAKVGANVNINADPVKGAKQFETMLKNPQTKHVAEALQTLVAGKEAQLAQGVEPILLADVYGTDAYTALNNANILGVTGKVAGEQELLRIKRDEYSRLTTPTLQDMSQHYSTLQKGEDAASVLNAAKKVMVAAINDKQSEAEKAATYNTAILQLARSHAMDVERGGKDNIYKPIPVAEWQTLGTVVKLPFYQKVLKPIADQGSSDNSAKAIVDYALNAAEKGVISEKEVLPSLQTFFKAVAGSNNIQSNYAGHGLPNQSTYIVGMTAPLTNKTEYFDLMNPAQLSSYIQIEKYIRHRGLVREMLDKSGATGFADSFIKGVNERKIASENR